MSCTHPMRERAPRRRCDSDPSSCSVSTPTPKMTKGRARPPGLSIIAQLSDARAAADRADELRLGGRRRNATVNEVLVEIVDGSALPNRAAAVEPGAVGHLRGGV